MSTHPVRKCTQKYHDWVMIDSESDPRRFRCKHCGKHVPAEPSDDDYEFYRSDAAADQ